MVLLGDDKEEEKKEREFGGSICKNFGGGGDL